MLQRNGLKFLSALFVAGLTSACGVFQRSPVEPIVELQMIERKIEVPRRPDAIPSLSFETPLVLTNERALKVLQEIEDFKRPSLNHVCFTLFEYQNLNRNYNAIEAYLKQAEAYFAAVEKQAKQESVQHQPAREPP